MKRFEITLDNTQYLRIFEQDYPQWYEYRKYDYCEPGYISLKNPEYILLSDEIAKKLEERYLDDRFIRKSMLDLDFLVKKNAIEYWNLGSTIITFDGNKFEYIYDDYFSEIEQELLQELRFEYYYKLEQQNEDTEIRK